MSLTNSRDWFSCAEREEPICRESKGLRQGKPQKACSRWVVKKCPSPVAPIRSKYRRTLDLCTRRRSAVRPKTRGAKRQLPFWFHQNWGYAPCRSSSIPRPGTVAPGHPDKRIVEAVPFSQAEWERAGESPGSRKVAVGK